MPVFNKLHYWLSIILTEIPEYMIKLSRNSDDWLYLTNRKQKTIPALRGPGLCFLDEFTSQLRAPKLFPSLSTRIFNKALENNEFRLLMRRKKCQEPLVSYIIGHSGNDKVLHLNAVLQSIAGQSLDSIECIVVEQSNQPEVVDQLPDWVTYYHLKVDDSDLYNRSLSFNFGASKARGKYLVLHDNDLLIPSSYTKSHVEILEQGFDIVNLKRFIFGLSSTDTENFFFANCMDKNSVPEYILQNAKGGGSLFISKTAYQKIGGFDEQFLGWGGEDNEFWQRAQVLNIYPFANLPMVHLWHAPQIDKRGGKAGGGKYTEALLNELSKISIYNRIQSLKVINQ